MECIKITCPNCGNVTTRYCNPEIPTNKFLCANCENDIIVTFDNNEVERWDELMELEENDPE